MRLTPLLGFGAFCAVLATLLSFELTSDDRRMFLPGETTDGHYQIEQQCEVCHTPMMGVRQEACEQCHAEELALADDSHPASKFSDPRTAHLLERIDATRCTTCHVEHRPQLTGAMGLTMPADYCVHCHSDIEEERPSHAGAGFASCQSVGCHSFHDNRSLHEDFLEQHVEEAPVLASAAVTPWREQRRAEWTKPALTRADQDAPPDVFVEPAVLLQWESSHHAAAQVNCSGCHTDAQDQFQTAISADSCASCHEEQTAGFRASRHGMRVAQQRPAMRPEFARQPMKDGAHGRAMDCTACHGAHDFRPEQAAVDACLQCHDDGHSKGYLESPHYQLWLAELSGDAAAGSGVSCATCHMPLAVSEDGTGGHTQHNQNDNLRPRSKMLRSVCMHCHGADFGLDALADAELVQRNFDSAPQQHIATLDWIRNKQRLREAEKTTAQVRTEGNR